MGLVYQTNKQTGITYAYENEAYWTKTKNSREPDENSSGK